MRIKIPRSSNLLCAALSAFLLTVLLAGPGAATAEPENPAEWPHWRGPARDGISQEKDWMAKWPESGPEVVWRVSVGTGFSSMTISGGRLYTMGNTASSAKDEDQKDQIFCLDAATENEIWKHTYTSKLDPLYYKGGPSATPTVDGDRIYTFSKTGLVLCLDAATGKVVWSRNIQEKDGLMPPKWGFAGSVLVSGNLLVINAGDGGIALKKKNGSIAWKGNKGLPGYSTPLPFKSGKREGVAFFSDKKLVAVNPATGKRFWDYPWKTAYFVNAADPVFIGDRVFVSSGYKRGCALLKVGPKGLTDIWHNSNMSNQCNSSVVHEGHIYGFDGNVGGRGVLRCLDIETGEVKWSQQKLGTGSLMLADGKLIILSEQGLLAIANAVPDRYDEIQRTQVLKGLCWTVPVLCNGKIYARCAEGDLVCVDPKTSGDKEVKENAK